MEILGWIAAALLFIVYLFITLMFTVKATSDQKGIRVWSRSTCCGMYCVLFVLWPFLAFFTGLISWFEDYPTKETDDSESKEGVVE